MKPTHRTTRRAFSLIEMLVVVAIAAIVLALTFPMIGAMQRDSSASNGVNTITVAIPSVRRYATDNIAFPNDVDPSVIGDQPGLYSGAAAIFTPAGEIRLTRNIPDMNSPDFPDPPFFLERRGPQLLDIQAGSSLPKRELNGFEDIPIDYLLLPSDTGVAGINRVSGGNNGKPFTADPTEPPLLLPPPFAVWFNQSGYLVATGWDIFASPSPGQANHYEFVFYHGDLDRHNIRLLGAGSFRGMVPNYDPDKFNPNAGNFDRNNYYASPGGEGKYKLPFDIIEAVVGVYVYSRNAFQEANDKWNDGETDTKIAAPPWTDTGTADNTARWEWMKENGEMVMFSRQTGAIMRNRNE